jgi:broad specificity phosphatase PhoE
MRHCQTFGNAKKIGMGVKETQWSTLSVAGFKQAIAIANKLFSLSENFSKYKFIASPFTRTQQTLRIILDVLKLDNLEIEIDPLISSKNKGIFEDMYKENIKKIYPEEIEKKKNDYWNYKAPGGGESMDDLYKKILNFVKKHTNDKDIVLAMHETGCGIIKSILEGEAYEKTKMRTDFKQRQDNFMSWDGSKIKILDFGELIP